MNALLIIAAAVGVASAGVLNVGGAYSYGLNAGLTSRTNRHLVYDVPSYTYGDAGLSTYGGYNGYNGGSYSYLYRNQNQPSVSVQQVPLVQQATYVTPKVQSVVAAPQVSTYTVQAAPAVSTYKVQAAPVVQTVQAAPVVSTYKYQAAPVVQTVQAAPVVQTVQAAPVVSSYKVQAAAPVVSTYKYQAAPVVQTVQAAPVVQSHVVQSASPVVYNSGISTLGGYTLGGSTLGGYTIGGSTLGGYTLGGSSLGGSVVYHK